MNWRGFGQINSTLFRHNKMLDEQNNVKMLKIFNPFVRLQVEMPRKLQSVLPFPTNAPQELCPRGSLDALDITLGKN